LIAEQQHFERRSRYEDASSDSYDWKFAGAGGLVRALAADPQQLPGLLDGQHR